MSVVKVVELIAQSDKSWEDAVQVVLNEASRTIHDITGIYVRDLQAVVENGKISKYRLNAKVSFVVKNDERTGAKK
jgi:flavin-binding protein dodecin